MSWPIPPWRARGSLRKQSVFAFLSVRPSFWRGKLPMERDAFDAWSCINEIRAGPPLSMQYLSGLGQGDRCSLFRRNTGAPLWGMLAGRDGGGARGGLMPLLTGTTDNRGSAPAVRRDTSPVGRCALLASSAPGASSSFRRRRRAQQANRQHSKTSSAMSGSTSKMPNGVEPSEVVSMPFVIFETSAASGGYSGGTEGGWAGGGDAGEGAAGIAAPVGDAGSGSGSRGGRYRRADGEGDDKGSGDGEGGGGGKSGRGGGGGRGGGEGGGS